MSLTTVTYWRAAAWRPDRPPTPVRSSWSPRGCSLRAPQARIIMMIIDSDAYAFGTTGTLCKQRHDARLTIIHDDIRMAQPYSKTPSRPAETHWHVGWRCRCGNLRMVEPLPVATAHTSLQVT